MAPGKEKDKDVADASFAQMLKVMDSFSAEDKVVYLTKKLGEYHQQNTKLNEKASQLDKAQKLSASQQKQLERANHIIVKTEESKSKLEDLCRELQKYNKEIREENLAKIKALESERQTAVEQLRVTLKDIEKAMQEGRARSDSLAEDNIRLSEKLQELGKEYDERLTLLTQQYGNKEKYLEDLNAAREIEMKLLKAKLEVSNINIQKVSVEKEELTKSLIEGTARVGGAIENEKILREQVRDYADKYSELTKSLNLSNQAFDRFKKEVDKVNSNFKKVENDALKWKQKYDEASKNVLVLTMKGKEQEDMLLASQKKLEKLESLCRALSARKNGDQENTSVNEDDAEKKTTEEAT